MSLSPAPAAAALLDAVDRARAGGWIDRGLALASLAGVEVDRLCAQPLGQLQRSALELHQVVAGHELEAKADCPACGGAVEFPVSVEELLALPDDVPTAGHVAMGEFAAAWRVPSVDDLRNAAVAADPVRALRARCVSPTHDGAAIDVDSLPEGVESEVERAMADGDRLAEVLVDVACPECGVSFVADLDPIGFVWAGVESQARRTLRQVDVLARAYGWTEREILALSPARRSAYLAIVRGERP